MDDPGCRIKDGLEMGKSRLYGFPLQSLLPSFQCVREDEHVSYGDVGMPVPPFGCSFSSDMPHLLAVTNEEGFVRLYDTECRDLQQKIVKDWQAHTNAVFDLAWVPGEHKLVTASGDQTAKLFDVKAGELLGECKGHQCSLKSVTFSKFEKDFSLDLTRDHPSQLDLETFPHRSPARNSPLLRLTNFLTNPPVLPYPYSALEDEMATLWSGIFDAIRKMASIDK
ncbi:unnamed protein product [Ranitomeya imitator]|uniref:Anaphase-promoting complex subunit 4-like WD40 domain-containing protein n=1 Tax=Ranitomeya imitator TaxID=111125 RepID=A0ABN9MNT4_9NEOB|nr:unnamed protein product [Ranitomeya imitator]